LRLRVREAEKTGHFQKIPKKQEKNRKNRTTSKKQEKQEKQDLYHAC